MTAPVWLSLPIRLDCAEAETTRHDITRHTQVLLTSILLLHHLRLHVVQDALQVRDAVGHAILLEPHVVFVRQLVDFLDQLELVDVDGLTTDVPQRGGDLPRGLLR